MNEIEYETPYYGGIRLECLLYCVLPHLKLELIRNYLKHYYSYIDLNQTPMQLAPPKFTRNLIYFTIVLVFVSNVNFAQLGRQSIMVENSSYIFTIYINFSLKLLSLN
jgi:hypothetical protein